MMTRVNFYMDVQGDREAALDLRDDVIEHLKELGIRLSLLDAGTEVTSSARESRRWASDSPEPLRRPKSHADRRASGAS